MPDEVPHSLRPMGAPARWGVISHAGIVRAVNQDSVIAGPRLFVVADGMGGHASGDVASAIAVARLAELDASDDLAASAVLDVVAAVNAEILDQAFAGSGREGMGTTLAGIAFVDGEVGARLMAFNVGDSRIYRWTTNGLSQVSADHSVVAELVRSGRLDPAAAATHPERHVITRALGSHEVPDIDHWLLEPEVGERFLICSDGLTNEVTDAAIEELLGSGEPPQAVADALLVATLSSGARDNVSAIVVDVVISNERGVYDGADTNPRIAVADELSVPRLIEEVPGIVPRPRAGATVEPEVVPVIVDVPLVAPDDLLRRGSHPGRSR